MAEAVEHSARRRIRIDWLKLGGVIVSLSLAWWFFSAVYNYSSLEDRYVALSKSLEQKNNLILQKTGGISVNEYFIDSQDKINEYVSEQRLHYTTAEILSHISMLSEMTYLADVSPRIKETRVRPGLLQTRVFIHARGKYHSLAKFINLLEQRKYRYPVRVNRLSIGRNEKEPAGDLDCYAELFFYRIPEKAAKQIIGTAKPAPGGELIITDDQPGKPAGDKPAPAGGQPAQNSNKPGTDQADTNSNGEEPYYKTEDEE